MGVNQRLLLDLEDPFPPQVSDYERCAGERDADADGGEGLVDGVGDDEGGRAGAQLARRRQLLPHVGHRAQQAHYVEAAARKESVRLREVSSCSFFTVLLCLACLSTATGQGTAKTFSRFCTYIFV